MSDLRQKIKAGVLKRVGKEKLSNRKIEMMKAEGMKEDQKIKKRGYKMFSLRPKETVGEDKERPSEVLQPVSVHLLPLSGLPPHKILPHPSALLRELFRAGVTNVPSRPGNSGKRRINSLVQNLVNCLWCKIW